MIRLGSIMLDGHPDVLSEFQDRAVNDNYFHDARRIKQALHVEPRAQVLPERLNLHDLKQIARGVNMTTLPDTASCALLAACVHYNIEKGGIVLCAKDMSLPLGMDTEIMDAIIFGKRLKVSRALCSLEEVSQEVLGRYSLEGNKSYIISTDNCLIPLLGNLGHDFNAVVLQDSTDKPFVQYVDAWTLCDTTPDSARFQRHFPSGATFTVRACT